MSTLTRAVTKDLNMRAFVINSKDIVNKAYEYHGTLPVASAALGRTLTAASMMGAMMKDLGSSLTLQIKGNGPIGSITTVSDCYGNVRGYADNPKVVLPLNAKEKLDVSGAVGKEGFVNVIKDLNLKEPYVGKCEIITGEIGDDITNYLVQSEQNPAVCGLGVLVDVDFTIKQAGGFIISALPFADDKILDEIERNVSKIDSVTALFEKGLDNKGILDILFNNIPYDILETTHPEYMCSCSRARYARALFSLGKEELEKLISEQESAQLVCHFCNKTYKFDRSTLLSIKDDFENYYESCCHQQD